MADDNYQSPFHFKAGSSYLVVGQDANGLPAIIAAGQAASDADIVTAIGADTLWADGSLYMSIVDGAGKLYIKMNDTWTDEKT
jgi:hypothetical protein